jgi:hypothetical protein
MSGARHQTWLEATGAGASPSLYPDRWGMQHRMTSVRRALLLAALATLVLSSAATADIGIRGISARSARPGEVVRVTARGCLGDRPWPAMPVVLVAAVNAPRPSVYGGAPTMHPERLRGKPYRLLGAIARWRPLGSCHGVGHLTFRVPRVARGRYVFGLFCDRCVNGPEGSLIIDHGLVLRVLRAN